MSYFSPSIQNEMIDILSNMIIKIIKSEVISANRQEKETVDKTSNCVGEMDRWGEVLR